MKPRVYVETSIPSFYYEVQIEPEMVARRQWTRQWWEQAKNDYLLVTSFGVLDELQGGDYPSRDDAVALVASLPKVEADAAIGDIVEAYILHKLMPNDPAGDALHLALASYHECDFLLTWNCRHLANAKKFGHIKRVNDMLGLYTPLLVTPLELLGD